MGDSLQPSDKADNEANQKRIAAAAQVNRNNEDAKRASEILANRRLSGQVTGVNTIGSAGTSVASARVGAGLTSRSALGSTKPALGSIEASNVPTLTPKAPTAPAPAAPAGESDMDKLYKDMMDRASGQWKVTEDLNMRNMAFMQRKSAAMQGAMGRSVAGGFAGAMGGAYLGGMAQMDQARAQHEQALMGLQLQYAKNKQTETWHAEASKRADEATSYGKERDESADYASMGAMDKIGLAAKENPQLYAQAFNMFNESAGGMEGGLPTDPDTAAKMLSWMMANGYVPA